MTELSMLGPVRMSVAGRAVELGPSRQRTVLAALALDAGRPVPTEVVIRRVWGDAAPAGARSGLYSYLTRLRCAVARAAPGEPPLRLVRRAGGYLLDADPGAIDLHRFQRLVDQAGRPGTDDLRRAALLDEAVALWRGPALADLSGDWAARTRAALGQRHLDAVLQWADVQLRMRRAAVVLAPVRELITEYPLVEPLTAGLIEALRQLGRTAEAVGCYLTTRRRLVDELGTEPGPDLRRLYQRLLRDGVGGPAGDPDRSCCCCEHARRHG